MLTKMQKACTFKYINSDKKQYLSTWKLNLTAAMSVSDAQWPAYVHKKNNTSFLKPKTMLMFGVQ